MADETPAAPAAPEPTPAEVAANDAHTETNAQEQSWGSKVEARLAAIEEKVGLKADDDADTKETN